MSVYAVDPLGPRDVSVNVPPTVVDARNTLSDNHELVRRELDGVVVGYDEHLLSAAKAHARMANRVLMSREDVADPAGFALAHRLIVSGIEAEAVVRQEVELGSKVRPACN